MIEEQVRSLIADALAAAAPELGLSGELPEVELSRPRQKEHGDYATNIALVVASKSGRPPREVAELLVSRLPSSPPIRSAEAAGPGFINIRLTVDSFTSVLREIAERGDAYGRAEPTGRRVQVEFVSANPTGPLHVGHARNAVLGDALARLFEATGWSAEREYYFNDTGGQMDRFGASVEARYLQLLGRAAEVPEDGYHGDYVVDLARDILETHGPGLADLPPAERLARLQHEGADRALAQIGRTLERFGISFDSYLHERVLEEKGEIAAAVDRLRASGSAYDAEGAVWFRSTVYGDDKDRPLIRSNGSHTYFGADAAYVIDKFERGFEHLVYVWGADHHGHVARVRGTAQALGYDPDHVEIVIYQWVSFLRGGEPVPMSKRAGSFVSLDELIDEVGADSARFHLLMFSSDATMRFDIEEVKRRSLENPVYYVQYGHARIASILRKAAERGVELRPIEEAVLSRLEHEAEIDLLRGLADVPAQIASAAELRAPHRLTHAAQDLAARFHRFYTECAVLSDDAELTQARLWLSRATKQVIGNVLGLLGVSAPESMERVEP
ncbi:MAG TPA: arginine--tRNA ligase [Actinomycetota bacterium]|nr:arginine--tRNA ligase [Actinomycetota bacterium]